MAVLPENLDEPAWYPMRIAYQQWPRVKSKLDELGVKLFFPMECKLVERSKSERGYQPVPLFSSLIFLNASYNHIYELKHSAGELQPLRFYTRAHADNHEQREIFSVPSKQMKDFMRLADSDDDRVVFLTDSNYLEAEGQRVLIGKGEFAGVEGVIKRIKGNKCVVIRIEGIAAIAYLRCPIKDLIKL